MVFRIARLIPVLSLVCSRLRRTTRLLAGRAVIGIAFRLLPPSLHPVRRVAPSLAAVIQNSLHRFAVVGPIGGHRRTRLLLATLLTPTLLTPITPLAPRLPALGCTGCTARRARIIA